MRKYFLLIILLSFALLSLTTLLSIVPELLNKQAMAFVLGIFTFYLLSRLPFDFYLRFSKYAYITLNVVLFLLLIYGEMTRGIAAWISLPFGFNLQPSQFAVPATALYLANYLKKPRVLHWQLLWRLGLIITVPFILILLAPDFGTAMVFLVSMAMVLWLNRLPWRYALALFAAAVLAGTLTWTLLFKDYQKQRILGFLNMQTATSTSSNEQTPAVYNARQALIAVGSGQIWGRGLGHGVQSHLRFLPERQTDFIFASFAEEWGFVGAAVLLSLYALLFFFLLFVANYSSTFAVTSYTTMVLMMFLSQTFINIGMNMSLLPITGITLPLMSYGGSSVLAMTISLAIVQAALADFKKRLIQSFY